MEFLNNMLLEHLTAEPLIQIDRILWGEPNGATLWLISVNDPKALPRPLDRTELETEIAAGTICGLSNDPYATFHVPEDQIPARHRAIRDRGWQIVEPLLKLAPGAIFDPEVRGRSIETICHQQRASRKTVYKFLRRFWQRGQVKNALLPDYRNCGGKHKPRRCSEKKRGRPNETLAKLGMGPGINIGPDEKKKIERGISLYYQNDKGHSAAKAYQLTLEKFFCPEKKVVGGTVVPVVPPSDQLPTLRQFRYHLSQRNNPTKMLIARDGERQFNLKSRPLLGDSTAMASGPGAIFQIDATIADIWLTHPLDRSRPVGKPTLYLIVDVFSRMIVGFSATLENPSYVSAMVALLNATEDKVKFCAEYGITITADQWPAQHCPEVIFADRGELTGLQTDHLVSALNIRVSNTPPYRADLKGIVERSFRTFNDELIHGLPGAVRGRRERGEKDPRLDAALNLQEFRTLVIHKILDHNQTRMENYRLQDFLIAAQVEPTPVSLWQFGIENRSGHLKQMDAALLRLNLLPHAEASITPQGIYLRGVYYSCERALREQWFVRAGQKRMKVPVAFDPRNTNVIFLHLPDENAIEPCHLLEKDARFKGISWREVDEFFEWQKQGRELARSGRQQSRAQFNALRSEVVTLAEQQTKVACAGLSKRARLKDVRQNRAEARELDQENQALAPRLSAPAEQGTILTLNNRSPEPGQGHYVPAPSPFEKLRQKRDQKFNQNEK